MIARLALVLAATLTVSGCAYRNPDYETLGIYERARPAIQVYSRNAIVCVPTALGNAAGIVIASPLLLVLAVTDGGPKILREAGETAASTPILIGGIITGSLFLPFSFLAQEDPCNFHI